MCLCRNLRDVPKAYTLIPKPKPPKYVYQQPCWLLFRVLGHDFIYRWDSGSCQGLRIWVEGLGLWIWEWHSTLSNSHLAKTLAEGCIESCGSCGPAFGAIPLVLKRPNSETSHMHKRIALRRLLTADFEAA